MPHANDLRRLDHLGQLLDDALAREDWVRVGEIDLLIRQGLQRLSVDGQLSAPFQARLAPLKARHQQALQACAGECQRLADLLASLNEHEEGRLAYALIDITQAEGQA